MKTNYNRATAKKNILRQTKFCPAPWLYQYEDITRDRSKRLIAMGVEAGASPVGWKRRRLTCPVCKRRLLSSVFVAHDWDGVIHMLPKHAPKVKAEKKPSKQKQYVRRRP